MRTHPGNLVRVVLVSLLVWLAGCSRQDAAEAPAASGAVAEDASPVQGQTNRSGSFLAYEHEVSVRMQAQAIAGRVEAVRKACMAERFGACSVLSEEQGAGEFPHGSLQMRADPQAIEPLVKLAAEGAEIGQRSTHAEDLADVVRDNGLRQARLRSQHEKLSALMDRRDAKLDELIALTQQLAAIEAELQSAEQEAAQQQRRVRTNLLTIRFASEGVTAESSRIRQAIRGLGDTWDVSIATLITVVGALLPFAAFGLLVYLLVRLVLRRKKA